ncbi:hypothetical protein WR25_26467 isoform P [Diploscapter pachys]|nr:hypothetical protein WR25_26467 isoform P [Diploscapter pachys]
MSHAAKQMTKMMQAQRASAEVFNAIEPISLPVRRKPVPYTLIPNPYPKISVKQARTIKLPPKSPSMGKDCGNETNPASATILESPSTSATSCTVLDSALPNRNLSSLQFGCAGDNPTIHEAIMGIDEAAHSGSALSSTEELNSFINSRIEENEREQAIETDGAKEQDDSHTHEPRDLEEGEISDSESDEPPPERSLPLLNSIMPLIHGKRKSKPKLADLNEDNFPEDDEEEYVPRVEYNSEEGRRILEPIPLSNVPPSSYDMMSYAKNIDLPLLLGRRPDIQIYDNCPKIHVDQLPASDKTLHFVFFIRHTAKNSKDVTADGCGRWTSSNASCYRQKTEHYYTDGVISPKRKALQTARFLVTKYRGPHPDAEPKGAFYRNVWRAFRIQNHEPVGVIILHYEIKMGFERIIAKIHGNSKQGLNSEVKMYTKTPPSKLQDAFKLRNFYSPLDIESMINSDGAEVTISRVQIYNQRRNKVTKKNGGATMNVKAEQSRNIQLAKTPYTFLETFDGKRTVRMYIPQESTMQAYADAALAKARQMRNMREGWLQVPRDTRGSLLAEEQPTEFLVEVCGNISGKKIISSISIIDNRISQIIKLCMNKEIFYESN